MRIVLSLLNLAVFTIMVIRFWDADKVAALCVAWLVVVVLLLSFRIAKLEQ